MGVPKNVFDVVKRRNNGLQRDIKNIVEAFWLREVFDIFEFFKMSYNALIYLPQLIDKPSIKLTGTCCWRLLRMYKYMRTPSKQ